MDENRITELWNKAVAEIGDCTYPKIVTRFAEFVAFDEREACAKICDERKWRGEPLNFAEYCAEEIRMRSNGGGNGRAGIIGTSR